jgi:sulfide:quinone oxidoreductase
MDHVDDGRVVLADGRTVDFSFAMILPPFVGQEGIAKATDIAIRSRLR